MDQAGDIAFRPHDQHHLHPRIASNAAPCTTTAVPSKRKASAGHPDAPPASRRQNFNQVVERAVPTAAQEAVKIDGAETEDRRQLHGDRPASKNGGSTMEQPIIVIDDDTPDGSHRLEQGTTALNNDGSPCTEGEPAAPWHGDNTLISPFGYKTWDPTDGGRYELLSTYMPPPCLDDDLEDALWGMAATYASPDLYNSPADAFWGTPDGVWTLY